MGKKCRLEKTWKRLDVKGLIVDEPWISKILRGEKHWEMRSQATAVRGLVALIRKGSGKIVGVARVTGCRGPLSLDELRANKDRHCVSMDEFESGRAMKWTTAWELIGAQSLPTPVPYKHPFGAVIWVNLDPGVQAAVLAQVANEPVEIISRSMPPAKLAYIPQRDSEMFTLDPSTLVPVANDGSWFGPDLLRAGQFTIGEKGDEQRLDTYEDALQALHQMPVPRWRRPNMKGNWGIVSGKQWTRIADLGQETDLTSTDGLESGLARSSLEGSRKD